MELEIIVEQSFDCIHEVVKNNLRLRLYQTKNGEPRYAVGLSAYNRFVGEWKLIEMTGGIAKAAGESFIERGEKTLHHFDWMEDELVYETKA